MTLLHLETDMFCKEPLPIGRKPTWSHTYKETTHLDWICVESGNVILMGLKSWAHLGTLYKWDGRKKIPNPSH
jgi:hypothetical protein